MTKPTKRFIAGAVCPRCAEMDRLVIFSSEQGTFKECVSCDFIEKQIAESEMAEIETRVNHTSPKEEKAVPIKFFQKPKK